MSAPPAPPPPLITLLTDFGLADAYVATMKAVILRICPGARFLDITHDVPPQGVRAGSLLLGTFVPYSPAGATHLAVVDPGVGTDRRAIAVRTALGTFVGPDNGLLSGGLRAMGAIDETGRLFDAQAVELTSQEHRLTDVSATFHGRDIFGPAAAHLANGVSIGDLGPPIDRVQILQDRSATWRPNSVTGEVVYVDRFGNAITNIEARRVPTSAVVRAGETSIVGIAATYRDGDVVALGGSSGALEIGVRNGSAARSLDLAPGSTVEAEWAV